MPDCVSSDDVLGVLIEFLERHPGAHVGAVTADAAIRVVPLPEAVPVPHTHPRIESRSLSSLLLEADQAVLSRTWWRARRGGVAGAAVRLRRPAGARASVFFFNLEHQHHILAVAMTEGDEAANEVAAMSGIGEFPARFARATKDGNALILDVDPAFERLLGYGREEIIGSRSLELVHPDDHDAAIEHWVQMCEFPGPSQPVRLRHRHRDGHWVWVEVTNHNRLTDSDHACVVADMVDVSEQVAVAEGLRARQQLLEQITETVPIGLLHADSEGRLLYANLRLIEITGLTMGDELSAWPAVASPHFRSVLVDAFATALAGQHCDAVVELIGSSGDIRHCSLSLRPLVDHSGSLRGVTGAVEDITASVVERRELEVRAATDALTGCLNRAATLAVIQDALDTVEDGRPGSGVAVIFVDVDDLKEVNDNFGHLAGDTLLVEVARRLRGAVRARDAVGRYGGDEFVVVASHVSSAEQALTVARWITSRTAHDFDLDGHSVPIRISVGVAWTDEADVHSARLVRRADDAMYRSKRDGNCEPVLAGGGDETPAAAAGA